MDTRGYIFNADNMVREHISHKDPIHLKHVTEYSLFVEQQCKFRNLASLHENNLMVEDSRCTTIIVHL